MTAPTCVALIPARSGSKRIQRKNARLLAGHPLIAYSIAAARESGRFADVIVSTDDERIAAISRHYGADAPVLRPPEISGDLSPDIEWVLHILRWLAASGRTYAHFSILRPTSPFRQPDTIRRALDAFAAAPEADSLRAVQPCREHPGKMWTVAQGWLRPVLDGGPRRPPWHSSPYQALPEVFVQNASLEVARCRVALGDESISGDRIVPFFTEGAEGFDLNRPEDWIIAEHMLASGTAVLPRVTAPAFPGAQEAAR